MARKGSNAAIAVAPAAPTGPKAPFQGPREQNPRRRKGRKGRRGRKRNPKKNLGYGAKVGLAIGSLVVVGGGSYLLYRHFKKPKFDAGVIQQAYFVPGSV